MKAENVRGNTSAAVASAAALSSDGYFLTVAHALANGPTHVVLLTDGEPHWAAAREVWSSSEHDVALVKTELRPDAWFELAADRSIEKDEAVLTFSPTVGPAAGEVELPVNLPTFGDYVAVEIPHDTPLRGGHSGGPAIGLDGKLVGVQTSTGMDTNFLRRSWLVHVRPALLERLMAEDWASNSREGSQPAFGRRVDSDGKP